MFKRDLTFASPWMNAAGALGFAPNPRGPVDLSRLGAFVTNPVSLAPRRPAESRCLLPYPGGALLHTGLPNPGLRRVIQRHAERWARGPLPVLVHLMPGTPQEAAHMVRALEGLEGVLGVEIGLPPGLSLDEARAFFAAASALGELPVVASLPLELAGAWAGGLAKSGISALSLAPPRGCLPGEDGKLVSGRLYGPGLLPLALAAVRAVAACGLAVIGAGGVFKETDAAALLAAGAFAVQWDTALWGSSLAKV